MRQLEMTPAKKAITSVFSIAAAALILALLLIWCLRRNKSEPVIEEEPVKEPELHQEEEEETSQESFEDVELAVTSKSSEDEYDKSISMCRSDTMSSLDVHTCASGSCEICRRDKEPNFLGVKKVEPGTEGRIRSLPDRWWENPLAYTKEPEVLQTIVSMSRSEASDWDDTIPEEDETIQTIDLDEDDNVQTRDESTVQALQGKIVRD